jgi:alkylation response protein AidB-like acyl-CoA dehydrogenase
MKSQYSELNFGLGETLDMLREQINGFATREIAPRAAEIDQSNEFPMDLWKKFGDMGLLGITVDEAYGGSGMGYLAHVIAMEEISRASASVGLSYGAHSNSQQRHRRAETAISAQAAQRRTHRRFGHVGTQRRFRRHLHETERQRRR